MNITLRQLKVFEAVARNRSYTRAAEALHLSQPAVSMQIRQLEDNCGLPLFEQMGKQTFLTPAGEELFRYASRILEQLGEIQTLFDELRGLGRGAVSISVATTASHFATRLLAEFAERNPGITVSLDVSNREQLLRQLDANERDFVIMGRPPEGRSLNAEPFMENPLVMIARPDHPLAGVERIAFDRLAEERFVMREKGSGTRGAIERFFEARGLHHEATMELASNEAIKQAVMAGLGLGIVSQHIISLEVDTGRLVVLDVEGFPIMRHWYLVQREGKRLSPVSQAFRSFVLSEATRFMPSAMLDAVNDAVHPSKSGEREAGA